MPANPLSSRYLELKSLEAMARDLLDGEQYQEAHQVICQGLAVLANDTFVWQKLGELQAEYGNDFAALKRHLQAFGKVAQIEEEALLGVGVDAGEARKWASEVELAVDQTIRGTRNPFAQKGIRETMVALHARFCAEKGRRRTKRLELWGLVLCFGGGATLGLNLSIGPVGILSAIQGLDMIREGLEFEGVDLLGRGLR